MRPPALPLLLAALAASFVPSFSEDGGVCEGSGYLIAFPPPVGLLGSRWGSEWTAAEPSNAYLLVGLDAAREKANEVAFSYCGAGLGGATVTCEAQVKGKLAEVIREGGSGGGQGHMSVDELCGYLDHELCFPEAAAAAVVVQMPASDFGRLKFIFEPLGNEEGGEQGVKRRAMRFVVIMRAGNFRILGFLLTAFPPPPCSSHARRRSHDGLLHYYIFRTHL